MTLPAETAALVAHQCGVATRQQLLDGGVTVGQLRWAMGGHWRIVLPRVVLLEPGLPSVDQRLVAALLFAGPDAWLGGMTAAAIHGMPGSVVAPPVQVLVPPHRTPRTVGWVRVARTYLLDERIVTRGSLRVSCRARAVVDAAAGCPDQAAARALIIDAVQQRLVRLDDIAHWVEARSNHGRRLLRQAVAEAAVGAWSVPEADLLRIVNDHRRLPRPWANPTLHDPLGRRLTTPDLWFDDVALAVMVHSRAFHSGVLDWEATVAADEDLRAAGVEVVAVTPASIAAEPERVLTRIDAAYGRALRRPRPVGVLALPRTRTWTFSGAASEAAGWS
jgi:hypothetical protein